MNHPSSRPLVPVASRSSSALAWLRRNWLTVGGGTLSVLFLLIALLASRFDRIEMPRKGEGDLAAIADQEDSDHLLTVHLCSWLYRDGELASWRELGPQARHLWTTLEIEAAIGRGDPVPVSESPTDAATLKDAAEGYAAFGQDELAKLAADGDLKTILRKKDKLLGAAHVARLTWVRAHARELTQPLGR